MHDATEPWSHNIHYHSVILDAVPADCARALDVGCGQGALTRRLRTRVPEVTGIDRDQRSIELARTHPGEHLLTDLTVSAVALRPFRRHTRPAR